MSTLTQLNTFSANAVVFTPDTVIIDRSVGNVFQHVPVTWNAVRTLGVLTGTGVQLTYAIQSANVTISFPDSSFATNILSISTVGNVTTVGNIRTVLDYNAARATFDPGAAAGNITYTVAHINSNNAAGNINVSYIGQPV
jgi:hypothetical protein